MTSELMVSSMSLTRSKYIERVGYYKYEKYSYAKMGYMEEWLKDSRRSNF